MKSIKIKKHEMSGAFRVKFLGMPEEKTRLAHLESYRFGSKIMHETFNFSKN